jgi:hypothetical protein
MDKELEKAIKDFIGTVHYDTFGGGYIWGTKQNEEGVQMIAEIPEIEEGNAVVSIRGWGAIQNMKNLPCSPKEFQDTIGKFVADAINEKLAKS